MKTYFYIITLFIYFANVSSRNSIQLNGKKTVARSLPVVDALISTLEEERSPEHEDCLRATLKMLRGVKNNTLWAVWVWDSMQPPVGSMYGAQSYLGNYDQCLKAPWSSDRSHSGLRSQYCLVEVNSPGVDQTRDFGPYDDAEEYYRTPTKDGRVFNKHDFGVCVPSICSPSSVTKLAHHLLLLTHFPGNVSLDPRDCDTAGEILKYPAEYYLFWALVGLLSATAIYSTLVSDNDKNTSTAFGKITKSFCVKRNYLNLFTVSRDEVKVMHGMRFLTAVTIVGVHEFFYHVLCPIINSLDLDKISTTKMGLALVHAEIAVDTFFAMSGLLIVRGLLQGKQKNAFFTLTKRYFRLIGPYSLCIMYIITSAIHMDHGPFYKKANRDEELICKQYWWKSLLMINTDIETLCHAVTWYISCDFQLTVLATFVFYLYRKSKRLGLAAFVMVALTVTVHLGWNVYWRRLDIIPFSVKEIAVMRSVTDLNYIYTKSHVRAGAYLVGMVMGFIITTYKPAEYRNVIGKKWSIIIASISLLAMVIVMNLGVIFADRPYNALEAAVVVATNRAFWALGICGLIGVCEYGTLSVIPEVLSWHGFVPLSKLSYCLYLLHPLLIQLYKYNARAPVPYHMYNLIINSSGVVVIGCLASLVLHLILEAPLINISNELFTEKSTILEQNGNMKDVNHNGTAVILQKGYKDNNKTKLL